MKQHFHVLISIDQTIGWPDPPTFNYKYIDDFPLSSVQSRSACTGRNLASSHSSFQIGVLSARVRSFRRHVCSFVSKRQSIRCSIRFNRYFLCSHLKLTLPALNMTPPSKHSYLTQIHHYDYNWQRVPAVGSNIGGNYLLSETLCGCPAVLNYDLWFFCLVWE